MYYPVKKKVGYKMLNGLQGTCTSTLTYIFEQKIQTKDRHHIKLQTLKILADVTKTVNGHLNFIFKTLPFCQMEVK